MTHQVDSPSDFFGNLIEFIILLCILFFLLLLVLNPLVRHLFDQILFTFYVFLCLNLLLGIRCRLLFVRSEWAMCLAPLSHHFKGCQVHLYLIIRLIICIAINVLIKMNQLDHLLLLPPLSLLFIYLASQSLPYVLFV